MATFSDMATYPFKCHQSPENIKRFEKMVRGDFVVQTQVNKIYYVIMLLDRNQNEVHNKKTRKFQKEKAK